MQRFSIKLDKRNLSKIFRGADKLVAIAGTQKEAMPKTGAEKYAMAVLNAINSVRWKYGGKYNQKYLDWKISIYKTHVPWKLAGDLIRVLKATKLGSSAHRADYLGGVRKGIYDSGGKSWYNKPGKGGFGKSKEIAWYGRIVEKTKPMFKPIYKEYIPKWKALGKKIRNQQRRAWK